jgi:hypothetical protein
MPTTDGVPPEPRPEPNIKAILALLAPGGDIEQAEKKQAEGMSTTGKLYQKIEKDMQGNRAAVSMIRRMQKMSADKRHDLLRTLEPLMVHFGYTLDDIEPDLVQQAQTKTDDDTDTDNGAGGNDPGDPEPTGDNSKLSGLDKARAHLTGDSTQEQADDFVKSAGAPKPARAKPKLGIVAPSKDLH